METVQAPENGEQFGNWNYGFSITHSKLNQTVRLDYETEPPHGDFPYRLYINENLLSNHLYWGRTIALSVEGDYLAITRCSLEYSKKLKFLSKNLNIETVVVELENREQTVVAGFATHIRWEKDVLFYQVFGEAEFRTFKVNIDG